MGSPHPSTGERGAVRPDDGGTGVGDGGTGVGDGLGEGGPSERTRSTGPHADLHAGARMCDYVPAVDLMALGNGPS
jgi:hypothetical protein